MTILPNYDHSTHKKMYGEGASQKMRSLGVEQKMGVNWVECNSLWIVMDIYVFEFRIFLVIFEV